MKLLRVAAAVAAGMFAIAGCQQATVDTAAVAEEMKRTVGDWATAYNAGDADAIAAMYSDDAVVMPPGTPALAGRDAIREFVAKDSANARAAGLTLAVNAGEVAVAGDLAWQSGSWDVKDAGGATVDGGSYVEIRRNVDGKWMIVRDIWNSDRPPAPAAELAAGKAAAP